MTRMSQILTLLACLAVLAVLAPAASAAKSDAAYRGGSLEPNAAKIKSVDPDRRHFCSLPKEVVRPQAGRVRF